jgi:hypothetical protein
VDDLEHELLLSSVQRLRGDIYLEDGAITPWQLSPEGRHVQAVDESSWHLLVMNANNRVLACVRYTSHSNNIHPFQVGVSNAALSSSEVWSERLELALESELAEARRRGVSYVEVGGWAIDPELRCTTEALRMALTIYGLGALLGGCLGITTATTRHNSSSILRRIGGQSLAVDGVELPTYFDPKYQCDMEILRFDSTRPNPRYVDWIAVCTAHLSTVPVIAASQPERRSERVDSHAAPMIVSGGVLTNRM